MRTCAGLALAFALFEAAQTCAAAGAAEPALQLEIASSVDRLPNEPFAGSVVVTNHSNAPLSGEITVSLQEDGKMLPLTLPDAELGADHALASRSRTVAGGRTIAEGTLTDGLDYTAAETTWTGRWEEADEFVELDMTRTITALGWRASDANWIWKANVLASADGVNFTPVPELQDVNLHQKWGLQQFPSFKPFRAKAIQLHYHRDGQKMEIVRMPAALRIWDGPQNDSFDIPRAGSEIDRLKVTRRIAAGAAETIELKLATPLQTGQYLLAARAEAGGSIVLAARHVFVEPAPLEAEGEESRFGLNGSQVSLAKEHRRLGVGWVRFENFKWPFVSPAPRRYAFDGSVTPWVVNFDEVTKEYRAAGLHILPMMFLTPQWASRADEQTPEGVRLSQPPRDFADFGEFAFQAAARYGSRKIEPAMLKTADQVSGLNRIRYFELGNEPNLNPLRDPAKPPTWGAWAGTMPQWWEMWRHGVEGLKRADPSAIVLSPGFAGATVETVDELRTFRYPDGKRPLDFVEVLSVHYYSGRTPPETATGDGNTGRESNRRFVEHLDELVAWRDRHKPGMPIWMTETGFDSAGPFGTDERAQAARLPRVVALCLAHGIDKVFVYRESGSAPSMHAAAGVLRDDRSRKPSWYTYATLIRQLHGASPGPRLRHDDPRISLLAWQQGEGVLLMANTSTGEARLGVDLGAAEITDAFGRTARVASTRDVVLREFPLYLKLSNGSVLSPLLR